MKGKIYLGQTINPVRRWKNHKYLARKKPDQYIGRAVAKYGINNFNFEIIASCKTLEDSNYIETLLIEEYNSCNKSIGYNISPGGAVVNVVFTDEHKRKLSIAAKGKVLSKETRELISKGNKGKIRTQDFRQNVSKVMKNINRKFSDVDESDMMKLYVSGATSHEVAKIYNCHYTTVVNIANRHGCVKSSGEDKRGKPSNRRGAKHSQESIQKMSKAKKKC